MFKRQAQSSPGRSETTPPKAGVEGCGRGGWSRTDITCDAQTAACLSARTQYFLSFCIIVGILSRFFFLMAMLD